MQDKYPDIAAQWHPTKNGSLTPSDVAPTTRHKAWWQCTKQPHAWLATVGSRTAGRGCPYCSGKRVLPGFNDLATVRPDVVSLRHPTRNASFSAQEVSEHSNKRVWWLCPQGHEWEAAVCKRSGGKGCPYCSGHKVWCGFNDLATTHPELASQWHPDKNGDLTTHQVSAGSQRNVWWLCELGHPWEATIANRVVGNGCHFCSGHRVFEGHNDLATTYPALAAQWHQPRNSELTPKAVSHGSHRSVWWVCEIGHEYKAAVVDRTLLGNGCPYCANRKVLSGFNDLSTVAPHLASEWHPTRNGAATPDMVLGGGQVARWWMCAAGHEWLVDVGNRIAQSSGCGRCSTAGGVSKVAERLRELLRHGPWLEDVESDPHFAVDLHWGHHSYMRVDVHGVLAGTDVPVVVEYDGGYWHSMPESLDRDMRKTEALLEAGYYVVRVRENELPHLPLSHPQLLQVDYTWHREDGTMVDLVEQIEYWLSCMQRLELLPA